MSTRHDEEVHRSSKETTIKENEWEIENVIVEKACNPLGYWDAVEPALECECETGKKQKKQKKKTQHQHLYDKLQCVAAQRKGKSQ